MGWLCVCKSRTMDGTKMKRLLLLALLIPTSAYAQGLSQYGDWGQPPETTREPLPDMQFLPPFNDWSVEILPEDPYLPPYLIPPKPYVDPMPDWGETTPFLKYKFNSRPVIEPIEPEVVSFPNDEEFGTILISTKHRKLFFTLNKEQAYLYPIGVGRQGFTWSGQEKVTRIEYWPTWYPPKEMLARRPELPERMEGGIKNPLGAVAIYLGNSLYRIHGTNDPKSIGKAESSGCFRMMNEHAMHLASIVDTNTIVKVYK